MHSPTIKKLNRKAGEIISRIVLMLFICWLITGIGYRLFCQENIQEKKNAMYSVLSSIDVLDQYTLKDIHLVRNTKALIAQTLTAHFVTDRNKDAVLEEITDYLLDNGWNIISYRNTNQIIFMEAKKDDYICVIETYKDKSAHIWRITINHDDFFSRYNL